MNSANSRAPVCRPTLRCAKQDVHGAGAVHLVLLGNDDGKRSTGSAYILKSLSKGHLCVEEDQIHHHSQISDFPPDGFRILPTVGLEAKVQARAHTKTEAI